MDAAPEQLSFNVVTHYSLTGFLTVCGRKWTTDLKVVDGTDLHAPGIEKRWSDMTCAKCLRKRNWVATITRNDAENRAEVA